MLQRQNEVVVTDTVSSTKQKIFTIWPMTESLTTAATEMFSSSEVHQMSHCIPFECRELIVKLEGHKRKGLKKIRVEGRRGKIYWERTAAKIFT